MLSEAAESSRLHQGFAAGLSNMAWAAGQVVGGVAGGAVASVTGNAAAQLRDRRPAAGHRRLRPPRPAPPAAAAPGRGA